MITMTRTMITLHIIYCIVFRLLKSKFFNNWMTKVKISCFYFFNQKMRKSRFNFGTKRDFAFIFSLVTTVITHGKVAKPTKRFLFMKFLSKLSPKCTNEWLGVVARHARFLIVKWCSALSCIVTILRMVSINGMNRILNFLSRHVISWPKRILHSTL